jgi:hypothetical protein
MPSKIDSENDVTLEIHLIRNYGEFSYTDSNLQCFNENEDWEEVAVEQIADNRMSGR